MSDLIINIEKKTRKVELEQLYLGNDHENLQEKLVFEFDEFVDGQGRLEYEINGTKNYIILTKENETYTIPVRNVITIYQEKTKGKVKMQLVITEGTDEEEIPVFKSNIFYLRVRPSINAVNEAPEGYELWIEQANAKLNAMDEALTEVDNLDLDISQEAGITTLTITKKDGTQESESIEIPTKLSDLTNDNNTVQDASYVHTDNNYTTAEKSKLAGLSNYDDTEIRGLIAGKVDKETGKGLSTNDYTTAEKTKLANLENYNDAEIKQDIVDLGINKADKNEIPDISSFITKSVNDLVYYYKKTETYTQAEVNSLIGAISTINIEVVQTLPTQDISTSTIYLVPKTASTNDNYDEYIYVSNSWEHIGSTDVDLSGYQTKIDSTHKLLSDLVDDTSQTNLFVTSTEKSTWNAKYDKPSGGIPDTDLSSAVQTSLGKADTAIQDISGKLDTSKVKALTSTTSGDVYDVTYINTAIGDIETLLSAI